MPRKVRQLEAELKRAGFEMRAGRGSHRNWSHSRHTGVITMAGKVGDDAKPYQEKQVAAAIEAAKQA